jgi:phosphopentomutase
MRAFVLVIDSFGIGALPDAADYGDEGANTALSICRAFPQAKWQTLGDLGLGNAAALIGVELPGCPAREQPLGYFGIMKEKSPGKDTTTGHWEMAGLEMSRPFHTFPPAYPSFPRELLKPFCEETDRQVIGNKAASGTEIIQELGEEHQKTGALICYTSADSVFQIAAHEQTVPVEELYRYCEIARQLCNPLMVGRVIARPFEGPPGNYTRTSRRRDFSLPLPEDSLIDYLHKNGVICTGVGKIGDIFNESGLDRSFHDKGNPACLDRVEEILKTPERQKEFVFVNLVDTDMTYGHRRDIKGYGDSVEATSVRLPGIMAALEPGDVLIITADHGCDPGFKGTDHTREYVPLLVYQKPGGKVPTVKPVSTANDLSLRVSRSVNDLSLKPGTTAGGTLAASGSLAEGSGDRSLGVRSAFSDLAASLGQYFLGRAYPRGVSFF